MMQLMVMFACTVAPAVSGSKITSALASAVWIRLMRTFQPSGKVAVYPLLAEESIWLPVMAGVGKGVTFAVTPVLAMVVMPGVGIVVPPSSSQAEVASSAADMAIGTIQRLNGIDVSVC